METRPSVGIVAKPFDPRFTKLVLVVAPVVLGPKTPPRRTYLPEHYYTTSSESRSECAILEGQKNTEAQVNKSCLERPFHTPRPDLRSQSIEDEFVQYASNADFGTLP